MGQLQVQNLDKSLGGRKIIDRVSFTIDDGEFFVLLGPSGCGKSTLLRLICGLETPDGGSIWLNGANITAMPPRERNLGMVFQDYGLYPNMNVYQNIAYGLEARSVPKAEIERRIPPAAEKLGLGELLKRNIGELSGGEQQRVALARAMVKDAEAYLYDEPLSNLDPKLRHKARNDIMEVHRLKGKPSIYVTHDQAEAFAMADRIAIVSAGRVQQIGTADELLTAPANTFVASFIGAPSTNLLEGKLYNTGDQVLFVGDGITIALPERWMSLLTGYGKDRVIAGIPPTAFHLGEGENAITTPATLVELLLGETIVGFNVGASAHLTGSFADLDTVNEGDTLTFTVDPEHVLLFDYDSQQALQ